MPIVARIVLRLLGRLRYGQLTIELPDGSSRVYGTGTEPQAAIAIKDWRFFAHVLLDGDLGFAAAYIAGYCDSQDLSKLIVLLAQNQGAGRKIGRRNSLHGMVRRMQHGMRKNSREGAKRNIHAHYDLGNDFFRLWLDQTMTYSSALYGDMDGTLEAAQARKYERILTQLGAKAGDEILEIGFGWGSFAEHAARCGMNVTAITISRAQFDFAQKRLQKAGLGERVNLQLCDYRDSVGRYRHVVSIEMIEAVGKGYWPDYFAMVRDRLAPGGSALIQAIVIADDLFESYRRHPDFIQTYIFPGGFLPSLEHMRGHGRRAGLEIADLRRFGSDYARTLTAWLERFDSVADQVARLGFDQRFRRMWRYYLAYGAAAFSTQRTDVLQAHFRPI